MSAVINLRSIRHMQNDTFQPYDESRLRYESRDSFDNGEKPTAIECDCGILLSWGAGLDQDCECGAEYNSSGQRLRKDWQATCCENW